MADLLRQYEDITRRSTPDNRTSAILYTRVYNVPKHMWATVVTFARGDILEPEDITAGTIPDVRVMDFYRKQQHGGADDQLTVIYYVIKPYA